jgi:hypothetical protein
VPSQSKDPPNRWQCPTRGGVRPCSMGWQLMAIAVGAPTIRTFAVISPTSHHSNGAGRASRSVARKGDFCPNSLKIKRARRAVRHLAIYTVGASRSGHSEPKSEIVRDMLGALAFFVIQATQCLTHCEWGLSPHVNIFDPPGMVRQQGRRAITPTTLRGVCGLCSSTD